MRILFLIAFCLNFSIPVYSDLNEKESSVLAGKKIDIQKVMDYPLPHVVSRFCKDYSVSKEDAKKYERELKRYLILACIYSDSNLPMLSVEVDNLWHTFLLFTKDYQEFCHEMLGTFIHHVPIVNEEIEGD